MKDEKYIKKRFDEVNPMSIEALPKEIEQYLKGYSDALEWVLELQ